MLRLPKFVFMLILALGIVVLPACQPAPTTETDLAPTSRPQPTPIPPPAPGKGFSVLAQQITKHPESYEGQYVTLVGYFRGQDLLDEVVLDAPVNQTQDWVIKDETDAIWVTDQGKLPFPPTSHEVWRVVRVSGEVKIHANGMPYIVAQDVKWEGLIQDYDVLPASCIVAVHRFGGPDQLDHHIYWYDSRNLVVYDARAKWRASARLTKGEVFDLQEAFSLTHFFKLPATVGQSCQDCIRYTIAAVDPKKNEPHFVTLYQGSVPDGLQRFIDRMIEMTGKAGAL
jgi:hypothetical protein